MGRRPATSRDRSGEVDIALGPEFDLPAGIAAITRRIALMVRGPTQLHRPAVTDCLACLTQALRAPAWPARSCSSSPR